MGMYDSFMAARAKKGYRQDQLKPYSHYNDPIDETPGRAAGNSRRWGDASPDVQGQVIETLIGSSRQHGLDVGDTARVLAIVRAESGFNPDAASSESAAGIGQFLDGARKQYGVANEDMFDIKANADAVVDYYMDCREKAQVKGFEGRRKDEMIYKYYHDGLYSDNSDFGGLANFSKPDGVGEWIHKIEDALNPNYQPGVNGEQLAGPVDIDGPSSLSDPLQAEEELDLWSAPGMSM